MASETDQRERGRRLLGGESGEQLAAEAQRGRQADADLAVALHRPPPRGCETSAGYLDRLGSGAALPWAVEGELVAAAQAGDLQARARLVEAFMPLIASVARMYRASARVERQELLQEGVVGLLRALHRYEPQQGVPFWGYASWWARQAMQQLVSELTGPVVLSDRALRHLARLRDAHGQAVQQTGREPLRNELVRRSGLSREQVDDLLSVSLAPRSVDEPISAEQGAVGTLGELLVDPLAESEYERVLEAIETEELLALLAGLSGRERSILRARYGLEDGHEETLRQVGGRLGLSAERVRQIEERALGKLAAAAGVQRPDDDPRTAIG
jgi:RNA polymerase primary sigma factor